MGRSSGVEHAVVFVSSKGGSVGSPTPAPRHAGLEDESALFRHEVAFCLGQRQDPAAIQTLESILRDTAEHPM